MLFDMTRRDTYNHITNWLTGIHLEFSILDCRNLTNPSTVIVMIGNKLDLAEQRAVSFEEATKFAEENNLIYVETSAKSGKNVEDCFLSTAGKISEKIQNGEIDPNSVESGIQVSGSNDTVTNPPPSSGCQCILI